MLGRHYEVVTCFGCDAVCFRLCMQAVENELCLILESELVGCPGTHDCHGTLLGEVFCSSCQRKRRVLCSELTRSSSAGTDVLEGSVVTVTCG